MQAFADATTPQFAVESAKRTKRGLLYKKAVFPRASYGLGAVAPSSSGRLVFTFDKIALAKGQVFSVYSYEKGGARNLVVTMNDEWERCEWGQNRLLAGRIVSALQARGHDAALLVPEENDISLPERCRRVNEWCRQLGKDNVLLISIHCNAAGRGDRWLSARGWCAYTSHGNTRADALATSLYTAAQAHLPGQRLRTDYTDADPDADPDLEKDFYLLRHTLAPAVLVENLFMDNPPTAPFSSAKKANNPLLTSMSMASSVTSPPSNAECPAPPSILAFAVHSCPPCPFRPPVDTVDKLLLPCQVNDFRKIVQDFSCGSSYPDLLSADFFGPV